MTPVEHKMREYLARHVSDITFRREEDLFAAGLVNSLMAIQLIMFIEREFSIVVADQDLELDNFRSIAAVENFVQRKHQAGRITRRY